MAGLRMRSLLTALPLLGGCEVESWRNADLQLEISGASLDSETLIKVCVDGAGSRQVALGAGRVAFPGLPAEGPLTVTVDAVPETADTGATNVDRLGRAGPVDFDGQVLLDATWLPCEGDDCEPCRESAVPVDAEQNRLLGVRFLGLD